MQLPREVLVREVGPRDGFQNEPVAIPTPEKIALIDALARTGLRRLEVASFVRADVIPQLADAVEVLQGIDVPEGVSLTVLVPNERGLETALEHRSRFHEVTLFVSATETHNRRNVNRSVEESATAIERMIPVARANGLRVEVVIAVAFGCPFEGYVSPETVVTLGQRFVAAGADEVGFGDTTGMANPVSVRRLFSLAQRDVAAELTAHFHNTRGQGLANTLAALQEGVTSFESSFGELGGCPVPPGSTGNIATEDLVSMLHEMGVETGVNIDRLVDASRRVQAVLGRRLGSHVLTAGPVVWHREATV